MDKDARIEYDIIMRRAMQDRFGLGNPRPEPRPIVGSMYVAGGFVMPALFGIDIQFADNEAPWPFQAELSRSDVLALEVPDLSSTWPMDQLIADMDTLESQFGYVIGDFDTDGILSTALLLRGQQLFIDFFEDPPLVHHLFAVLSETYALVANYVKSRTGTCAVATNRSILNVDPELYLHSNCSVQMISPSAYEEFLLPYELYLAERLQPYGIHHCGNNLHLYADLYSRVSSVFFDVGWGSDVFECRRALPEAFLNLRLSPVRVLQQTPDKVKKDVEDLLSTAGSIDKVGMCCINMDFGTPDENVTTMMNTAVGFRPNSQ
jgi:uroporphyrinogen-III decarboxylase